MSAPLLGCLAGFFLGALSVLARGALGRVPDIVSGSTIMNGTAFAVTAAAAAASGIDSAELDLDLLWPFLVIGAVVPGATQMLYIRAVRDAGPARTQIVMAGTPLVAALLALVLLDEHWSVGLAAGTVLVVLGGATLVREHTRPVGFRAIGIGAALVVATLSGARDTFVRWAVGEQAADPLLGAATALLASLVVVIVLGVLVSRRRPSLAALGRALPAFLPVGVLMGLSYVALFAALDRGPVTLVVPFVGTHAIWAAALGAVALRGVEVVGPRVVVAAALVVTGASLAAAFRGAGPAVSVEDAVAGLDRRAADASVYVYRTEGSERTDAFLGSTHPYPAETALTVSRTACGRDERWAALRDRTIERTFCREPTGLVLVRYVERHRFYGRTDERPHVCGPGAVYLPDDPRPGTTWEFVCPGPESVERWRAEVLERGPRDVGGETVEAVHLRFDTELTGGTHGAGRRELWLRAADGLLLGEEVTNESRTETLIGSVGYTERYRVELTSETPRD